MRYNFEYRDTGFFLPEYFKILPIINLETQNISTPFFLLFHISLHNPAFDQ